MTKDQMQQVLAAWPHGEPTWLPTCDESKALYDLECKAIAIMQAAVDAPEQEPVAYRSRMRPLWGTRCFTEWSLCSKELHDDYKRAPILHDWEYQAEALYTKDTP